MDSIKSEKSKIELLTKRIIHIKKAIDNKEITFEELARVAELSTADLEKMSEHLIDRNFVPANNDLSGQAALKLFNLLTDKKIDDYYFIDAKKLEESLFEFEESHGDYLCLSPLGVRSEQTTANYLNDFATFSQVFVNHTEITEALDDFNVHYKLNFDLPQAKQTWLAWKEARPMRLAPSVEYSSLSNVAILEKFLAGVLKPNEWLTDIDIERSLRILNLNQYGVHVIPFKVDDIGLTLHFERQKHAHDDPKKPYVIPLILNLGGDDHSRIDSRGIHWTRMLVTVDPSVEPPTIAVNYNDTLYLAPETKIKVVETISNALIYRVQLGGYGTENKQKNYFAFPDYTLKENGIQVSGSAEQVDSFTCGYRAIKGIVEDLVKSGRLPEQDYKDLVHAGTINELRDFIYTKLIGDQIVSEKQFQLLKQNPTYKKAETAFTQVAEEQYKIKSSLIKGQLFQFETSAKKFKLKQNKIRAIANKQPAVSGFNPTELEQFAKVSHYYDTVSKDPAIQTIQKFETAKFQIDVGKLISDLNASNHEETEAVIRAIFKAINKNEKITELQLDGLDRLTSDAISLLKEELDLAAKLQTITSANVDINNYGKILAARNQLLNYFKKSALPGEDLWDTLFTAMVLELPEKPSGNVFNYADTSKVAPYNQLISQLSSEGIEKLFQFFAAKEFEIKNGDFPYSTLRMTDSPDTSDFGVGLLALKKHLQSDSVYLPFKKFAFKSPDFNASGFNLFQELKEILPLLNENNIDTLELVADSTIPLTVEQVNELIQLATNLSIKTHLKITGPFIAPQVQEHLTTFQNLVASNRRKLNEQERLGKEQAVIGISVPTNVKTDIKLGKIGKAIFGNEGSKTEIDVSRQQQQQTEQQAQSSVPESDLPEEEPIAEEVFVKFSGKEELVDLNNIEQLLGEFITNRNITLSPVACWDLMVGKNADQFRYGIKKMTLSAAKYLIENLTECQSGINPDNPPKGFYIEQKPSDKQPDPNNKNEIIYDDLVLCYDGFNPRVNPNHSPLTPIFRKPLSSNTWQGDITQFLNQAKIEAIWKKYFKKYAKTHNQYSLENCKQNFFFIKDLSDQNINLEMRSYIFNSMIESLDAVSSEEIKTKITQVFGKNLTAKNILALSEVLYVEGSTGVKSLLTNLADLKNIKGEGFFASFKKCFIDTSFNLNELLNDESKEAMQKLQTLSKAESNWWMTLTEQHTSNNKLRKAQEEQRKAEENFEMLESGQFGERWAHLGDLVNGFTYFLDELTEIDPTLTLTDYCPFQDVGDLRDIYQLLTILRNAHDVNEQFYSLNGLSLDVLGPFYASRYEGYKIVTADMELALGKLLLPIKRKGISASITAEKNGCEPGCCYRFGKDKTGSNFGSKGDRFDPSQAYLLRYVATFNHRSSLQIYRDIFNYLKLKEKEDIHGMTFNDLSISSLYTMITAFGTGKRGKNVTLEEIETFINILNNTGKSSAVANISMAWRGLRHRAIKPTIKEITFITKKLLDEFKEDEPSRGTTIALNQLYNISGCYGEHAEEFFKALTTLSKNNQSIKMGVLISYLFQIEDAESFSNKEPNKARSIKFLSEDVSLRANLVRVLAVVSNENFNDNIALLDNFYQVVAKFKDKHGSQLTRDLVQILSSINIERSTALPNIQLLTALIDHCAQLDHLDFNNLLTTLKEGKEGINGLPDGCVLGSGNAKTATSSQQTSDLYTTIAKHMRGILEKFAPHKAQISLAFGENFYASLEGPEGPSILLNNLNDVKDRMHQSNLLEEAAQKLVEAKIMGVMKSIYESSIVNNIASMNLSREDRESLQGVIEKRIQHPILKKDFGEFCTHYASELKQLERFLVALRQVKTKWPDKFGLVIDMLSGSDSLKEFNLLTLAEIFQAFASTKEKAAFPNETLKLFFTFKKAAPELQNKLVNIIQRVMIADENNQLSFVERQSITQLTLKFLHNYSDGDYKTFIDKLKQIRSQQAFIFGEVVNLMLAFNDTSLNNLELVENLLIKLKDFTPEIQIELFKFYSKHPNDFTAILMLISSFVDNNIPVLKIEKMLFIVMQAIAIDVAQYNQVAVENVITELNKLDEKKLSQLADLYNLPPYPTLNLLTNSLQTSINFEELAAQYDLDPTGHRSDRSVEEGRVLSNGEVLLNEQFSLDRVPAIINNLRDLNNGRPLLYSQREKLYRWFLYINAIGKDYTIPTNPENPALGNFKAVKDLSHAEITHLIDYYRKNIKNFSEEQKIKAKLEYIAIAREVMYRTTGDVTKNEPGRFPYPTQILYMLNAMLAGKDFIAQIQTGQGKSLTAALAASLLSLEGQTVDICTSNLFLAQEGLDENKRFFEYMGIPAKLIDSETSTADDYQAGGIHYSSMTELALYRSNNELLGKIFPAECSIIADEVDYSVLDDPTRYRFATFLDPVTNPYVSPYKWIYEALVDFVDTIKTPLEDHDYLEAAKKYLQRSAKGQSEREALKKLEEMPDIYNKRLETWLIAAAKTAKDINFEEIKFRVIRLEEKRFGVPVQYSKACILMGGRPYPKAEMSNSVQQFLHIRLRRKYQADIEAKKMPDFDIEPERSHVASYNSKILLSRYQHRLGMSGTVGSAKEIQEQYEKYGFHFVDIPPYQPLQRKMLKPILTNAKFIGENKAELEEQDHIYKTVKEIIDYLLSVKPPEKAGPVLLLCEDKNKGMRIQTALNEAINKHRKKLGDRYQIQEYYSSEKPTPAQRNQEEKEFKEKAGADGFITISTVFDRGTDIKVNPKKGLYVVQTFADTDPYSAEDLERAKTQKIGRAGRQGQIGRARLILKRSQFSSVYTHKDLKNIPETIEGVEAAIKDLNEFRNKPRTQERIMREYFDDVEDIAYKSFLKFTDVINSINAQEEIVPTKAIREQLLKNWNLYMQILEEKWSEIKNAPGAMENPDGCLRQIAEYATSQWPELNKKLTANLRDWINKSGTKDLLTVPSDITLNTEAIIAEVKERQPAVRKHYIKKSELLKQVDPKLTAATVYADFFEPSAKSIKETVGAPNLAEIRQKVINAHLAGAYGYLRTSAHQQKLRHLNICTQKFDANNYVQHTKETTAAYLYLMYKQYLAGNNVGLAAVHKRYRDFLQAAVWSRKPEITNAIAEAQAEHCKILLSRRGEHEDKKSIYLRAIVAEASKFLPKETAAWKNERFAALWSSEKGIFENAKSWLVDYKTKWWARGWVSNDRKEVVDQLVKNLLLAENPETKVLNKAELLNAFNLARKDLLINDAKKGRKMQDGLDGRLNKFIDETRTKLLSTIDSASLDSLVRYEFEDVQNVLRSFLERQQIKGNKDIKETLQNFIATDFSKLSNLHEEELFKEVYQQYQMLLTLFAKVDSLGHNETDIGKDDLKALYRYCQKKQGDFMNYFAQCESLSAINKQGSVEVYRASSKAVMHVVKRLLSTEMKKDQLIPSEFQYLDDKIIVKYHDGDTALSNPPYVNNNFFRLVNNANSYQYLLSEIEKAIVEKRVDRTEVEFSEIYIHKDSVFPGKEGFKLNVKLAINGIATEVNLHFNLAKATVYTQYDENLMKLDALSKGPFVPPPLRRPSVSSEVLKVHENKSLLLDDEASKTFKTLDDHHQQELLSAYLKSCEDRKLRKEPPLNFVSFLKNYLKDMEQSKVQTTKFNPPKNKV